MRNARLFLAPPLGEPDNVARLRLLRHRNRLALRGLVRIRYGRLRPPSPRLGALTLLPPRSAASRWHPDLCRCAHCGCHLEAPDAGWPICAVCLSRDPQLELRYPDVRILW